ncbi:MAG: desulfoferrodoxin [Candidatus Paceibacterota bacterium]|jgi:superoxide reductase
MNQIKQICKCNICGNVVEVLHIGTGELICCGQPMEKMVEKIQEEGFEKHLPIIEKRGNVVKIKVGEVLHPMEDAHFIEWIEVIVDGVSYRKMLKSGQSPEMQIEIGEGDISVRSFCNVHGLWKSAKVSEVEDKKINFAQFEKIDLRIAKIIDAVALDGSDKLLKLNVEVGDETRQILAGIGKFYKPEELIGKSIVIVANLEPRMLLGQESQGMVLAARDEQNLSVLVVDKSITSGIKIS